ncbi:hypothetical protein GCM10011494_39340 [Novosphingobium endophyticum]|uniref:Uncharacterized protein n=2 Tax=Novosphingobium endophyticum TaxID=1955250 RepID=A0A916TWP7_9SPHN|nr:hypothetical protein GCM10011494_39340 [Novosphingobium endophyticum]
MRSAFKVIITKVADTGDPEEYDMPHSSLNYLMDPQCRYRAHYPDAMEAPRLAATLRREISESHEASK